VTRSPALRFFPHLLALSIASFFALSSDGCSGDDPANPIGTHLTPDGTLVSTTGCKQFLPQRGLSEASPNQDCAQYEYDGNNVLTLKHINAGFNCCPGEITADIDIENHVITVVEHESEHGCRCLCLFDVDYKIEHIEPGAYEIKFVEPYTEAGDDPLAFTCDLSQATSGTYCVERTHYPWDAELSGGAWGRLLDMVGCKEPSAVADSKGRDVVHDCIEYGYLQGNILLLKHVNAAFNCCPTIATDITVEDGAITVVETELDGRCDCYCLFDLYYMTVNLPVGEYTISVHEHYAQAGDEELEFYVDLRETSSGTYCVERNHSPW